MKKIVISDKNHVFLRRVIIKTVSSCEHQAVGNECPPAVMNVPHLQRGDPGPLASVGLGAAYDSGHGTLRHLPLATFVVGAVESPNLVFGAQTARNAALNERRGRFDTIRQHKRFIAVKTQKKIFFFQISQISPQIHILVSRDF